MRDTTLSFAETALEDLTVPLEAEVHPSTGAAVVRLPLALTPGRSGFGPQLALEYDSAAGNSPYGVGWTLSGLLSVAVDTRRALPHYDDRDRFVFAGGELVPAWQEVAGSWRAQVEERGDFWVHLHRGRVETAHIRVERWVHKTTGRVHWRTRDARGAVTVYGLDPSGRGRIADPADPARTFAWLPEAQYDLDGNAIAYEFAEENRDGVDLASAPERTGLGSPPAQRHLKRIRYGNTRPLSEDTEDGPVPGDNQWSFEAVFDYGDHAEEDPRPSPDRAWAARPDPFTACRPGFAVRTYRLCRRILLFHRFAELGAEPVLVGAHRFEHDLRPEGSALRAVAFTGFRASGEPRRRSLPPLRFTYSAPAVAGAFEPAPVETAENVPQGLSGPGYRWLDLYGEGLPGILTETEQAWYFKPNEGGGRFGPQRLVVDRPAYRLGSVALSDFDGDGNADLAVLDGRQAGFYELDRDAGDTGDGDAGDGGAWTGFRPFPSLPHLEAAGAKAQWLDLDGDGRADLVLADPQRFVWYPSLGKEGFGAAVEIGRPAAAVPAAPLAEDLDLHAFFADMNGDGLLDQVLIHNGRVEYLPHLGHGRFGEAVLMEDSPVFAPDEEFEPRRLLLVDLDGNGAADLLYVGRGEVRTWINAGGNRWLEGRRLGHLPYVDNVSTLQVLDFLGDGTPCLVWSSPLAGRAAALQYLPLGRGVPPRLLLAADNSMGREVRWTYSTSAAHYLRDRRAGHPWSTRLPHHPVVVDRLETADSIGGARTVARFEYHDGLFDGAEQAFRGFGRVDRYDAELHEGPGGPPEVAHTTPACLRTWFHLGRPVAGPLPESWRGDPEQAALAAQSLERPEDLDPEEEKEALRALAGQVIRQELFAVGEDGRRADHPFQVTQSAYRLRRLQPAAPGRAPSFTFWPSEQLTCDYEQQPADPRVTHELTLEVDRFGQALLDVDVAYGRRPTVPPVSPVQAALSVTVHRHRSVHVTDNAGRHEIGIPVEEEDFEAAGLTSAMPAGLFQREALARDLATALASPLDFHQPFTTGVQVRRIGWHRLFYWNDAATAALALGSVGARTLLHHEESAAFTPAWASDVFGTRVDAALLAGDGGYRLDGGYWWQPGETHHFEARSGFHQLARLERAGGAVTRFRHDAGFLNLVEIEDALGNRTRAEIDYHLLAPHRLTDANGTVAEVLYDPLGVAVVATVQGRVLDAAGNPQTYGQERLSGYTVRPPATLAAVLADPAFYLQKAARFVHYELDAWATSALPPRAVHLVREELAHDGEGGGAATSRIQVGVDHLDGFGRTLQSKVRVEAGPALARDAQGRLVLDSQGRPVEAASPERWAVSGHTVYNRKQQPVRQYEPFFSVTAAYEPEEALARFGVSREQRYDAAGRLLQEDRPDGTFTRTEHRAWEVRHFDPNDTVLDSPWREARRGLPDADPRKKALRKAEAHAGTPTIVHLDPRGLEVRRVEMAPAAPHRVTETAFDAQGAATAVVDARGLTAYRYRHDMLGRTLFAASADAGDTWTLLDLYDRPVHVWDSVGVHQRRGFDALDRPVSVFVDGALGLAQLVEQRIYGEDPSVDRADLRNARGRLALLRDSAGTVSFLQYDFEGRVLASERQVRQDFKTEPDWRTPRAVKLEAERHATRNAYDALGRVRRQSLPDGTVRRLTYLQSGGLERLVLDTADGAVRDLVVFEGSSFNARGQRTGALLGNKVELSYRYDPATFRTARISARRLPTGGGTPVDLQDLEYVYDPAGNVTWSVDHVQQPARPGPFLTGLGVSSECEFTYDSFYQLTEATGRVHQALLEHDYRPGLTGPGQLKGTRHLTFANGAAVERYRRTYEYDLAGNLRTLKHLGTSRSWTTEHWVSATSNRSLPARDPAGVPVADPETRFDRNGNTAFLPYLRRLDWNYHNGLARAVIVDRSAAGDPDDAEHYVYDGDGLRLRKVTETLVAGKKVETTETLYLDGCEIKRVRLGAALKLERFTSHLSDGAQRIALLHRWRKDDLGRETGDVTKPRLRYQLNNHLGSAQLELDERGAVISYEEYFPFGGTSFVAGDDVREIGVKAYRFCGKERDDATGLCYFEYRYYAPWMGRWISPDPIGPEDDENLYKYVFNNPVNFVDPEGLRGEPARGQLNYMPVTVIPPAIRRQLSDVQVRQITQQGYGAWVQRDKVLVLPREDIENIAREQSAQTGRPGVLLSLDPNPVQPGRKDVNFEWDEADEVVARRPPARGTGQGGEEQPSAAGDSPPAKDAASGSDGTDGQAKGPTGSPAGSHDTSSSRSASATGSHAADGSSPPSTPPSTASEGKGSGKGVTGTGKGGGGVGRGVPGGTGTQGSGAGAGSGSGTGTRSVRGTLSSSSASSPPPDQGPETATGLVGLGVSDGTGTRTEAGVEGNLAPSTGVMAPPPGQTVNGDDPNGTRRTGPMDTGAPGGRRNGPEGFGSRSGARANPRGEAGGTAERPVQQTLGDRLVQGLGYLQGELGGGDPERGQSGGLPGGTGTHNFGGWGQALFALITIALLLGRRGIKTLVGKVWSLLRKVPQLFTRAFWRRLRALTRPRVLRRLFYKRIQWKYGEVQTPGAFGETDKFGNIIIREGVKGIDLFKTVLHEGIHQFFGVRSGSLWRANLGAKGYKKLHLFKYIEEALAETVGTGSLREGLKYPFKEGIVSKWRLVVEGTSYFGVVGSGAYMSLRYMYARYIE